MVLCKFKRLGHDIRVSKNNGIYDVSDNLKVVHTTDMASSAIFEFDMLVRKYYERMNEVK